MPKGIIISKPGHTVDDEPQHHYVNSTTPLLKVYKNIAGTLTTDGYTYSSEGEYSFTGTMNPPGTTATTLTLAIPHDLGYVPMAIGYVDMQTGGKRRYITTSTSGVALEGDVMGAFRMYPDKVELTLRGKSSGFTPGDYGYYIGIFYLSLTPPEEHSFYE